MISSLAAVFLFFGPRYFPGAVIEKSPFYALVGSIYWSNDTFIIEGGYDVAAAIRIQEVFVQEFKADLLYRAEQVVETGDAESAEEVVLGVYLILDKVKYSDNEILLLRSLSSYLSEYSSRSLDSYLSRID